MIDGEQYVTITTGWGSAYALAAGYAYDEAVPSSVGKVVTFKVGATQEIAAAPFTPIERTPKAAAFGTPKQVADGTVLYSRNCMVCHGPFAASSGVLPDLRWSVVSGDKALWNGVLLEGNRASNGMVSFADYLTPAESEAVRAYVLAQAHAHKAPAGGGK